MGRVRERSKSAEMPQPPVHTPAPVALPALPLLQLDEARPKRGRLERCYLHNDQIQFRCQRCDRPICQYCLCVIVDDQALCSRCGQRHLPSAAAQIARGGLSALVILSVLLVVGALLLLPPFALAIRAALAMGVGLGLVALLLRRKGPRVQVRRPRRRRSSSLQ